MGPPAVVPRLRRWVVVAFGVGALFAAVRGPTAAPDPASLDAGAISDVALRTLASGLGSITSIVNAGDSRLFLTLRSGRIVIWDGTRARRAAFLDISRRVSCCGERGLLSVAFHPSYASNGFFFVSYTDKAGNLVIARYRRSAKSANRADRASRVVLLTIPHPSNADHHGGQLQFGPDGYLYVGVGDGGSAKDSSCSAQRDDVLLGKILRLDVDVNVTRPPFYGVPPSNPFVGAGLPQDEIWAKGLRDPWRFSFDRLTGDLYIGDVGQGARQEIDFQPRSSRGGENYGWTIMEGSLCGSGGGSGCPAKLPPCQSARFQAPIFEYGRLPGECAVAGGYVYRGSQDPRLSGVYFYGDYCTGHIWGRGQLTNAVAPNLTTFGEDSLGELYVGTGTGTLYGMVSPPPPPPEPPSLAASAPEESAPPAPAPFRLFAAPEPIAIPQPTAAPQPSDASPPPDYPLVPDYTPLPPDNPPPPDDTPPPPDMPPPPDTPAPTPPPEPDRSAPARAPRELPPAREVKPR